jgi:hypothetical protein
VHCYNLKTAWGILQIANKRRSLRHVLMSRRGQSGRMTERIAAILESYESVAFRGVEPFDRALGRRHCERTRSIVAEVCHV